MNCLGKSVLDSGHKRLPLPPLKMTAVVLCAAEFICGMIAPLLPTHGKIQKHG